MKSLAAAIVYALAANATLGAYAVASWLPAAQPLILGLVGVTVPFVAAVVLLEPELRENRGQMVLTVALALVFGGVLPAAWMAPAVRKLALDHFADRGAVKLALNDSARSVAEHACGRLFSTGLSASEIALELAQKPSVAVTCLDAAQASHRQAASRLLNLWQDTLTHGPQTSCELAERAGALRGVDESTRAVGFLHCALAGEDAMARQCCVAELKVMESPKHLRTWLAPQQKELNRRHLLGDLLLVSHREPQTLKSQAPGMETLGLQDPAMQHLTLEQACEAYLAGDEADRVASGLRWVFGQHLTCLSEDEKTVSENLVSACRVIVGSQPSADLGRQICAADQVARREQLEEIRAREAQPVEDLAGFTSQISRGSMFLDQLSRPGVPEDPDETEDGEDDGEFDSDLDFAREFYDKKMKKARRQAAKDR